MLLSLGTGISEGNKLTAHPVISHDKVLLRSGGKLGFAMDSPACFQAIYKHVGQQKIDVDVYLPSSQNSKRPVCTSEHLSNPMAAIDWRVHN